MDIPARLPRLRWLLGILGVYAAIWLILEGSMARDLVLAGLVLVTGGWYCARPFFAGRRYSLRRWLLLAASAGLLFGATLALSTFFLMALKTGLHAHGPEYTAEEVRRLWRQMPSWAVVGAIIGLGLGLLSAGLSRR